MPILVSDEKLFVIVLFSAFVNNNYITSVRDVWKNPWVIGTAGALSIGLVALVAPFILSAIINALGFTAEGVLAGSFGAWFMSLYKGIIARGSLVSILQSIGAAGLGALGIILSSGFGAAIVILLGAIYAPKLAKYIKEMELNRTEEHTLESFVQIEENIYQDKNKIIIFKLKPALLYNDKILKCFLETFKSTSLFANSKLFRLDFIDDDLLRLKSEEERLNNIIHNLLIDDDCEKSRIEFIFHDNYLVGCKLNLSGYKPSDPKINLLVEIWKVLNGNVVNIDFHKLRDQIKGQIDKIDINKFFDQVSKIDINKLSSEINKIDINKLRDQINNQINRVDINKLRDQVNSKIDINKININKFRSKL
ncbi:hypothetical protein RclHR1_01590010 [Rhizophagus clarus]|uniref:Interferon alpha-inducible protein 27-like protein 1 n=1 Tax=Rhizophagus clarus TaxID=94130 RepID=A0A2Z6QHX0_9GLOM|nr:hypothetical protein RclHR1_01590010 [Rhizophagus clarus]GES87210.1 interferon alpha-inducible protein 27-like protein 1 [Rhizophagus clarus]